MIRSINLRPNALYRLVLKSYKTILNEGWISFFRKVRDEINKNRSLNKRSIFKTRNQRFKAVNLANHPLLDLPSVDIIIVTYNSANDISSCIESILTSKYPKDKISVTIVDNNSTDNTKLLAKDLQVKLCNIALIESSSNIGYGAAINWGFKRTTAKYLLILNPDTKLPTDTLKCLVNAALETEQDGFCAWEARQQPFEHPKLYDPVTLETEWVSGACLLVLRKVFVEISGFDENIFLYGEDVDLSWRMRGLGYKLQYVPSAIVIHKTYIEGATKPTQFFNSIIANGILRFKHGKFMDIAAYYFNLLMVLLRPPRLRRVRLYLVLSLFASTPKFLKALACRVTNRVQIPAATPIFNKWDYEIRRRGAFYVTKERDENPLVSIIIRTVQRPYFLREALQSIRNQTYRPLEVIIIEDGAPKSEGMIHPYADLDIHYKASGTRVGRSRAGNLGLSLATGKYINFLDDDDLLFADHVEVLVSELEADKSRLAAYSIGFEVETHIISIQPFVYEETSYRVAYEKPFDRKSLEHANYIPINCMMFSRQLFLTEGGFDETLDVLEDWDLWLRYSRLTDFLFVEKLTCIYRVPSDHKVWTLRQQKLGNTAKIKNKITEMILQKN